MKFTTSRRKFYARFSPSSPERVLDHAVRGQYGEEKSGG